MSLLQPVGTLEENLEWWRYALERKRMKVSHGKTEDKCLNEQRSQVQDFKYLRSTIQLNWESGKEVKKRFQGKWRKVSGVICGKGG